MVWQERDRSSVCTPTRGACLHCVPRAVCLPVPCCFRAAATFQGGVLDLGKDGSVQCAQHCALLPSAIAFQFCAFQSADPDFVAVSPQVSGIRSANFSRCAGAKWTPLPSTNASVQIKSDDRSYCPAPQCPIAITAGMRESRLPGPFMWFDIHANAVRRSVHCHVPSGPWKNYPVMYADRVCQSYNGKNQTMSCYKWVACQHVISSPRDVGRSACLQRSQLLPVWMHGGLRVAVP